jgi:meso-butanediol dehydrogenase/(S,S)-butanediol dehydrogenase/diacetyl reductase
MTGATSRRIRSRRRRSPVADRGGRLNGKVALISGVGGGQGRAAALLFAREGAAIVGCDKVRETSEETSRLAAEEGLDVRSLAPLDLTDREQVRSWMDFAVAEHGGFDVLYNNASKPRYAPFEEMSDEDYKFTIDNEIHLVWYSCQAAWPHLVKRGGGSIINIGSVAGVIGVPSFPMAAHSLTKGAVIAFSRQLAAEGAAVGIRVNSIAPGVINSPPVAQMLEQLGDDAPFMAMLASTSTGEPGRSEDVAYAALYLASDESRYVTGANLVVDGGATVFTPPRHRLQAD